MSWVCEIACRGDAGLVGAAEAWLRDVPKVRLAGLAGLPVIDVYEPAQGEAKDPYNRDDHGPLFMILIAFAEREALARAMTDPAMADALGTLPHGLTATATALERRFYLVAGEDRPAPLSAPFSYVVRYHRPAEDEAAFIANYVQSHPTLQADLPGIRSIMCYFPLDAMNGARVPAADYMIGNEVVFDDLAAFNRAMASPVREALRAHFRAFPPFSGANTHYPMLRTRLGG